MIDTLHYEDFQPQLNTPFQLHLGDAVLELKLISAEDKSPSPRQEQFVLTFRGPRNAPPRQGIYQLRHAQLGSGEIFLVPVGYNQEGLLYEAIFNRKREVSQ